MPRVDSGWYFVVPLAITGCGLGLLVSQLNNYTLAPVEQERVSEAAGVNSAAGSFGLSFGLAMAGGIMLAALSVSFTQMTQNSQVIPAAQQQQIAGALGDDAEVMSNTQLEEQITGQPPEVEAEVVAINHDARNLSLQIALLVPLIAGAARTRQLFPDGSAARPEAVSRSRTDRTGLKRTQPAAGQIAPTPAWKRRKGNVPSQSRCRSPRTRPNPKRLPCRIRRGRVRCCRAGC